MSTSLNSNLEALFGKMEKFVSTKTVVGEPVHIDNVILVPLVDVSFGMGAGASQKQEEKNGGENAMGGLGAHITPSAVLVIVDGNVQLVNVKNTDSVNKLIDMVPGILSKLNLGKFFNKNKDESQTPQVEFESETIVEPLD